MDEEFVLMQREDSTDDEDSEEEISEGDSGLSEERSQRNSWGSLPDVCLWHVFKFLPDCDRKSADLVCHHWHRVMRSPSLWRHRFFHFSGRMSKFKQPEYCIAMGYAHYLGAYLETLEVTVCPPRRFSVAQRLEQTISGLFSELTRVKASLRSLSLVNLELDWHTWTGGLRKSLINSLVLFFCSGALKLTSVCLRGMQIHIHQGLDVLFALSHSNSQCYISSLDLEGFFSGAAHIHLNSHVPCVLRDLRGLTDLSLSYSCMSDELLKALQLRVQNSSRDGSPLQTLSLCCTFNETHWQLVSGCSWKALASSCPDLQVKLTVDQVNDTDQLARILLVEIPLTEYIMIAFYSPEEDGNAKHLLRNLLPQYRCSLQHLTLDVHNYNEPLDEELLELVMVCERLEQLSVWAFLEITTVKRLLQIRLTQRNLLNNITVRIYSLNNDTREQEDQLEEILYSYLHLPPELEFYASLFPCG